MNEALTDLVPLLDAELAEALKLLPPWQLAAETLPYLRQFSAVAPAEAPGGFGIENLEVPGQGGNPTVPVRIYRPEGLDEPAPVLLWMHGGGFVMGSVDADDLLCLGIVKKSGCVVVSVDYRLAPENQYPAALNDCYAALEWIAGAPEELGAKPEMLAVAGVSAGGCLAAAVALKARDEGGAKLSHQFLIIPVTDDRLESGSAQRIRDPRVWDREKAEASWSMYLGDDNDGEPSPYAAPGRAASLSGLPPATVLVEQLDLLHDEAVEYAERLKREAIAVELKSYPGTFHGHFGFAPEAGISKQTVEDIITSVAGVFGA